MLLSIFLLQLIIRTNHKKQIYSELASRVQTSTEEFLEFDQGQNSNPFIQTEGKKVTINYKLNQNLFPKVLEFSIFIGPPENDRKIGFVEFSKQNKMKFLVNDNFKDMATLNLTHFTLKASNELDNNIITFKVIISNSHSYTEKLFTTSKFLILSK